jgi:hypothetical protein
MRQMIWFRCLRCDREISAARRCPYCGEPTPLGRARRSAVLALLLGVPLAVGFFGIGIYLNGSDLAWLVGTGPISKITCPSSRAEDAARAIFNESLDRVRDLHDVKIVGLVRVRQVSRTPDGLRCTATGAFDDDKQRPIDYRFSLNDGQVFLEVEIP